MERYNCEHNMTRLWKIPVLLILTSSIALAQSANPAPAPSNSPPDSASTEAPPPDSTTLEIILRQQAIYPLSAARNGVQGEVMVRVTVSETGDVEKTEVLSGDPILADAAVRAAQKFKFKPFIRNGKPVKASTKLPFDFYFTSKMTTTNAPVNADIPDNSASGPITGDNTPKRVKISQGTSQGFLIRKVTPIYPPEAKRNRIQGKVVLRAVIGKNGRIQNLTPISGPKDLIPAAVGAVQQWQYTPYLLMGEPVEIDTEVTVNFQLVY
jgi:TonB family protein